MNKILSSLRNLLPADQINEVAQAVSEMIEESKKEMEAEYNKNLEEAYVQLTNELSQAEKDRLSWL